jgi:hypothetical protein
MSRGSSTSSSIWCWRLRTNACAGGHPPRPEPVCAGHRNAGIGTRGVWQPRYHRYVSGPGAGGSGSWAAWFPTSSLHTPLPQPRPAHQTSRATNTSADTAAQPARAATRTGAAHFVLQPHPGAISICHCNAVTLHPLSAALLPYAAAQLGRCMLFVFVCM